MSGERTEPTNEELAKAYSRQIEQARERREMAELKRLERHGQAAQAAANLSEAIEAEQQNGDRIERSADQQVELNDDQKKTMANGKEAGDLVKQAKVREIAERFKEKTARDREESRSMGR